MKLLAENSWTEFKSQRTAAAARSGTSRSNDEGESKLSRICFFHSLVETPLDFCYSGSEVISSASNDEKDHGRAGAFFMNILKALSREEGDRSDNEKDSAKFQFVVEEPEKKPPRRYKSAPTSPRSLLLPRSDSSLVLLFLGCGGLYTGETAM